MQLQPGERPDDAVRGCLGIALRRASLFGRAPVIHDLRLAFTIWGFLDDDPPPDLVECRRQMFAGVGNVMHHYTQGRRIADIVPESTLRLTVEEAAAVWRDQWVELTGATDCQ